MTTVAGSPNNSGTWTGGTSGATWTPSAVPVLQTNDERVISGNLTVRVALSSRVRSSDTATAVVAAGCFINTGGSAQTSNSFSGSVTNNSGLSHAKCFGQWAIRPFERWTSSSQTLAVTARHMYGVAAVDIILSDAHSNTVTVAATKKSILRPATGLWVEEWAATCSLSALTQGDTITARYKIYPTIGDSGAVFDSNANSITANNNTTGQCNYTFYNDKGNSANVYAVVNFSTGNDSTGTSSSTLATAVASPYLTIAKALTVGTANIIYIRAGTGNVLGGTVTVPSSLGYWRQIKQYPGDGQVVLQLSGTATYNTPHLSYENVVIQLATGANWFDGSASNYYLSFKNCYFDPAAIADNGIVSTVGYRSSCTYLTGCTFKDASKFGFGDNFAGRVCLWLDGCLIYSLVAIQQSYSIYRVVGCVVQNIGPLAKFLAFYER